MTSKFISSWFFVSLEKFQDTFLSFRTGPVQIRAKGTEFADALRTIHENFDAQGYDVVNVVPLSVGYAESCGPKEETVGFSVTSGAVVIGKRRE